MQRLPNPQKVPLPAASEKRACVVSKTVKIRSLPMLLVLLTGTVLNVPAWSAEHLDTSSVVVRGTSDARGRAIREHAEAMRREAFAALLGEESPRPWRVRCVIHVHTTPESFAAAVGGSPIDARGATSLEFAGDRVLSRRIDVVGDGPEIVPDAINHELVHVVLADHFSLAPPPRWADEGVALLFDSPEKQRAHEADFQAARRRGMAWSAEELLTLEDYPDDGGRQRVFYGQSAALVRWLIARRDAATFVRFLDDIDVDGIAASLYRHYSIHSLASVSSAWKEVASINSLGLSKR